MIIGGVSFYQRREIKDILAYLRISQSGADYISFLRTINLPKRGIGEATIEKIRHQANQEGMTILGYCEAIVQDVPLNSKTRVPPKLKESIGEYLKIVQTLRDASKQGSISSLVQTTIELTGYLEYLREDVETYSDRRENLNELIAKAKEWEISSPAPSLEAFLEELSLKSSLDEADATRDRVSLMTIHNGKGLEFTATFLVGLEEDLFPHINSKNDPEAVEEERRLCYVGITRAKEFLSLSYCRTRYLWGTLRMQQPSRFLKEIPREQLELYDISRPVFKHPVEYLTKKERKEIRYPEQTEPQQPAICAAGDRIFHKDFGLGQIQEAYQGSMGLTYKILFDKDHTVKTLVAKLAPLSKL